MAAVPALRLHCMLACTAAALLHCTAARLPASAEELEQAVDQLELEASSGPIECTLVVERPAKLRGGEFSFGALLVKGVDGQQWMMCAAAPDGTALAATQAEAVHGEWLAALQVH